MNPLVEKIQKLLAKAESTNNEHEAQMFFNKAQQLMAQNNISTKEVEIKKEAKVDTETIIDDRASAARNLRLATIVAKNFKVECYKEGSTIKFIGLEEDLEIAIMTFESIHKFMEKKRRQVYREAKKAGRPTKGIREDYVMGFLLGVDESFKRNVTEMGLVVVTPQKVHDVMSKWNVSTKAIKHKGAGNTELYLRGYQDGKGLGREIE
jgi:hypothetical protein